MKPATLSRRADFRRAYGEGRHSRRNGVGVVVLDRGDTEVARIGYAVKRSAGSSVARNRIKRRLRAAVGSVEVPAGYDIVVSGDAEAARLDFQVLVEKVGAAIVAAGAGR